MRFKQRGCSERCALQRCTPAPLPPVAWKKGVGGMRESPPTLGAFLTGVKPQGRKPTSFSEINPRYWEFSAVAKVFDFAANLTQFQLIEPIAFAVLRTGGSDAIHPIRD